MKINEVEAAVGVTKKNIRFYEEEGLITPSREPGNGYRSYSQADVERLRRIKLLRKLDVPLAEIRQMLEGECTLADGMTRQLERLNTRRADLNEAVGFCTLLQKEPVSLNELDVEQTLADAPPLPLLVVMFGIPAGCIIGTLKVLVDRLKEIGKGEEDAYRNY